MHLCNYWLLYPSNDMASEDFSISAEEKILFETQRTRIALNSFE